MNFKIAGLKLPPSNMGNDAVPQDRQQYAFQILEILWAKS